MSIVTLDMSSYEIVRIDDTVESPLTRPALQLQTVTLQRPPKTWPLFDVERVMSNAEKPQLRCTYH